MSDNHLTPLRAHHAGPLGQKDREIGTVATEGPSKTVSTDAHYNISHPNKIIPFWQRNSKIMLEKIEV